MVSALPVTRAIRVGQLQRLRPGARKIFEMLDEDANHRIRQEQRDVLTLPHLELVAYAPEGGSDGRQVDHIGLDRRGH